MIMKNFFSKSTYFLCTLFALSGINQTEATLSYETYLESWDSQWQTVMQNLPDTPAGTPNYQGTTLDIAFAAYLFPNSEVQGTQFQNPNSDIATIISFVHGQGGKVKLSYGGASYALPAYPNYFISQTTANGGWPNNMQYLAGGVINAIQKNYGTNNNPLYLDGVDFDIEDPQPAYSAQDFAQDLYNFLALVRAGLPDKTISLTIPGQGWNTYWEIIAKLASQDGGPVDSVNFMEYDIYITPGYSYAEQIFGDIVTYTSLPNVAPAPNWTPGWGIDPRKVQLGLMPANDDLGNNLTVSNAENLASVAATSNKFGKPLYGVMTWCLNRDALTDLNPNTVNNPSTLTLPPYQYSNAIRSTLNKPKPLFKMVRNQFRKRKVAIFPSPFQRQPPPPHGFPGFII